MKQVNKDKLQVDLIKYCDQIGVLPNERPRLVFDRQEMDRICALIDDPNSRKACNGNVGLCCWAKRVIWVSERSNKTNTVGRRSYFKRRDGWYRQRKIKKWTYSEQRHTLVHELVHSRFPKMKHDSWKEDRKYNQLVDEILKGKTFEPEHIHLYAHLPRRYTLNLEDITDGEKDKYFKAQEKAKATREQTRQKDILYWKLYDELKAKAETLVFSTNYDLQGSLAKNHNGKIPVDVRISRLQEIAKEISK